MNSSFFVADGSFYPFSSSAGNIGGGGSAGQFTVWTDTNLVGSAGPASGALLDTLTGFSSTGVLQRTGAGAYAFLGINVASGLLQLTAATKLPALDGSLLTNLTSAALSGALPALNGAALTSLTSANLLGALPAISGAALTSLPSLTGEVTTSGLAATINKAITPTWTGLHTFTAGLASGAGIAAGASGAIHWSGQTSMSSPADGKLLLQNNALTDFSLLQLGGTTSSFPAIKRSTAGIRLRLADDSADAALTLSTVSSGSNQVVGARVTGYTAMTGTPDKATAFATSTVTLAQLAGRVMQLQADLTTHGLIGA